MKRMVFACAVIAIACTAAACPQKPPSPEPDVVIVDAAIDSSVDATADATASVDAGLFGAACANLAKLGCKEGADQPTCVAAFARVEVTHLTDLHPECLAAAHSKLEARNCGKTAKTTGAVACP